MEHRGGRAGGFANGIADGSERSGNVHELVSAPGEGSGHFYAGAAGRGGDSGGIARAGASGESGAAGIRGADVAWGAGGIPCGAAIFDGNCGVVRADGFAAGGDGNLRRDFVPCERAHARDWGSPGVGSAEASHSADDSASRTGAGHCRGCDWFGWRADCGAFDGGSALRRAAGGSCHVWGGGAAVDRSGAAGMLYSSTASDPGGPAGSAAPRIAFSRVGRRGEVDVWASWGAASSAPTELDRARRIRDSGQRRGWRGNNRAARPEGYATKKGWRAGMLVVRLNAN